MKRRQLMFALLAAVAAGGLAGCQKPAAAPWLGVDIGGARYGQAWALQDQEGVQRGPADYRGLVALYYFGFTECPDICPATLGHLKQTLALLGAQARDVRVLFVTVDAEHDTAAVLKEYLAPFGPGFIGLTGAEPALQAAARDFRVYAQRKPGVSAGFEHAGFVYALDRRGEPRILYGPESTPQAMATDLARLLQEPAAGHV